MYFGKTWSRSPAGKHALQRLIMLMVVRLSLCCRCYSHMYFDSQSSSMANQIVSLIISTFVQLGIHRIFGESIQIQECLIYWCVMMIIIMMIIKMIICFWCMIMMMMKVSRRWCNSIFLLSHSTPVKHEVIVDLRSRIAMLARADKRWYNVWRLQTAAP